MECDHARNYIYGYVCEALAEHLSKEVGEHIKQCPGCAEKCRQVREIIGKIPESMVAAPEPSSPEVSAEDILRLARRRALFLRWAAFVIFCLVFGAILYVGLLIARYRYERALLSELEKAVLVYRLQTGDFPKARANLVRQLKSVPEARRYLKKWEGRIKDGQFVDYWGNPIVYNCPGRHNVGLCDIYSFGRNGRDDYGAGDDIKNWIPKK